MAGGCTWLAPVQFLVDSEDFCDVGVTSESCSEGTQLDAAMYVPSASWGVATGPLVLHEQAVNIIAKTEVNFLCSNESAFFVKSTKVNVESNLLHTELCFATKDQCSIADDCQYNSTALAFVCPGNAVSWLKEKAPSARCFFDSGFIASPSPSFSADTGICSNAVVAVEYNFTWSGQTITRLNATITLANISAVESGRTLLSQHFVATFVGDRSHAVANSSSSSSDNKVYPPSGNPGKSVDDFIFYLHIWSCPVKSRPTPFAGRMSLTATKSGFCRNFWVLI